MISWFYFIFIIICLFIIVYDKKSGHSKGYGFVEYVNQSDAESARTKLQQELKEKKLKLEYAPSGLDTYDKLHSTALCVENFPVNTSVEEIKELLSSEANILFCQVGFIYKCNY